MKKQAFNPYLPSYEYVPDGEPYVFGDRVYVFGSHDAFDGEGFCVNDYVCWSAPTEELGDWKYEGVIFRSTQDPRMDGKHMPMNAPDVCQGPDGRFYLYLQVSMQTVTTVAVADQPQGPYEFYGHVKHKNGTLFGKKRGDAYSFDPSVMVDDDGRIYMYTGSCPDSKRMRNLMKLGGGQVDYGSVVELEQDMLTVKGKLYHTVPGIFKAKGTPFERHGFYEASSIRKINGGYYLVYSSEVSHDLCYATSETPTGPWTYGGIIVSIGDIGLPGVTEENPRNFTGNTHGGMVCIRGQWYIFYHRQTNQQMCARQGCAEPIEIDADGRIAQVEVTSCGLNGGPLKAEGSYEARIACNLRGKKGTFKYSQPHHSEMTEYPYFTQSGEDRESDGDQYIANMQDGAVAGFKYFDFADGKISEIKVTLRGNGTGTMKVYTDLEKEPVASIAVETGKEWKTFAGKTEKISGVQPLYFRYEGSGAVDFTEFSLLPDREK